MSDTPTTLGQNSQMLQKLQDRCSEVEKAKAKRAAKRQAAWAEIQAKAPDHAQFLEQCRQAFGRPERLRVELEGRVVWDD